MQNKEVTLTGRRYNQVFFPFLFFLSFPIISLGVSITFYLFFYHILKTPSISRALFLKLNKSTLKFYLFLLIVIVSFFLAPRHLISGSVYKSIFLVIQYIYWVLVALYARSLDWERHASSFARIITYGLTCLTLTFFLINVQTGSILKLWFSRNDFVFIFISLWPICAGYIGHRFGFARLKVLLVSSLILMVLSNGRSGVSIVLIENILIYQAFIGKGLRSRGFLAKLFLVFAVLSITFGDIETARKDIGDRIGIHSERIGEFIKGEGSGGDLEFDKSWLTRQLMIEKSKEIIAHHPYFGIGVGNFVRYQANIDVIFDRKYSRLINGGLDRSYYNTRSSHNSYIHILSETGVLGFLVFIWILVPLLYKSFKSLYMGSIDDKNTILISIIGICIHFVAITSITGALSWFIIGSAYACSGKKVSESV